MNRALPSLALAAGIALLSAGASRSQPPDVGPSTRTPATAPTTFAVLLLAGIDDPAVVADLKLTDGQLKTLVARRQTTWDEAFNAVPKYDDVAARRKASDEVMRATLTADQYKRATQIGAQAILLRGGDDGNDPRPMSVVPRISIYQFRRYPDLAQIYGLTDDQKKALTGGGKNPGGGLGEFATAITVPPEQQKAATERLGTDLTTRTSKSDPRLAAIPSQPRSVDLLGAKDVRDELKLTDEHAKTATEIRGWWSNYEADRRIKISPKDAVTAGKELSTKTEKALAAALTPAQATRLRQIERQTGTFGSGWHVEELYRNADAAREFDLTAEQVKALDAAWETFRRDARAAFESGESYPATQKKVIALSATRRSRTEAVLTPAQAAKWNDTFGAPFYGSTALDRQRDLGSSTRVAEMRAAIFGKYSSEGSRLANDAAVHAELKLTPEQVKQAQELTAVLREKFGPPTGGADAAAFEKAYADRSAFLEAGFKKVLSPAQEKRFHEIMMQARESAGAL